ncbi:hypothetical protein QBC38DRAFT_452149 [Podospora fimiseda]|uniref:Uncharacterized protein n=1 Tax=Podospora fimiseda TaxID=252190 RepID=A0AAN7BVP6_9PEZI|nr:hypothetical protein QBC38DRAFT_452149 [Podospora fimiseda]
MSYHPFQIQDQPNFISSELKDHPIWSSAVTHLLTTNPRRWREANLPQPNAISLTLYREDTETYHTISVLLLTPDNPLPSVAAINNGALVFLLSDPPEESFTAFMNLQMLLPTSPMQISVLPLTNTFALHETLQVFSMSVLRSSQQHLPVIDVVADLIPYCHPEPGGTRLSREFVDMITSEEMGGGNSLMEAIQSIGDGEEGDFGLWRVFWEAEIECE